MPRLRKLLEELEKASTKEYQNILRKISDEVTKDDFRPELESSTFGDIVDLLIVLPETTFSELIEKFSDIIIRKIGEGKPEDFGKLFEGLSREKRKAFSRNFRSYVSKRLSSFTLREIVKMVYSVVPATRETLLNQYKEIMMRPDFTKLLLKTDIETIAEFLSVMPESIRRTLINRHKNFFLSDDFIGKLKEAPPDSRAVLLRWLPRDISSKIVEKLSG